jgi:hypothetical protein
LDVRHSSLSVSVLFLVTLLLVASFSLACKSVPVQNTPPAPPTPAPVNTTPYKFELTNISVVPTEAQAGTPIQVIVTVRNIGSDRNAYVAALYLDGQEYLTEDLTLNPGDSGNLVYVLPRLNAGSHTIKVDNLSGNVRIYSAEMYTISNTEVVIPRYTPLDYTPPPAVPYTTTNSFSPPVVPFFITRVYFRYPYPQSFQIIDSANKVLYSSEIALNESAYVPGIEVNGSFTVQMQSAQPAVDVRSQFYGFGNTWTLVIAYYWPQVSTIDGFRKSFSP